MRFLVLFLFIFLAPVGQASILMLNASSVADLDKMTLLDVRTAEQCMDSSILGALCLPAGTFYSEEYGLASFYHINWVLSTMGITENDTLLVFADNIVDRDAIAGLLFLAGQLTVARWAGNIEPLQNIRGSGPGRPRGITRTSVYAGTVRDEFIVFEQQIPALQKAGWKQLSTQSSSVAVSENSIVSASSPMLAIAIFARSLTNVNQALKVVIDQLELENSAINKVFFLSIFIAMLTAMLLAFILWRRSEPVIRN